MKTLGLINLCECYRAKINDILVRNEICPSLRLEPGIRHNGCSPFHLISPIHVECDIHGSDSGHSQNTFGFPGRGQGADLPNTSHYANNAAPFPAGQYHLSRLCTTFAGN